MDLSKIEQAAGLRFIEKIALGGMGEIWLARRERSEGFARQFAVKMILPHLTENQEFVRMFLDEGRLVGNLDHPNICQIIDMDECDGMYYMLMEYVDGVVLTELIDRVARDGGFLPVEHCAEIIRGASAGLDHAHSATDTQGNSLQLIHRDVSPPNIMIRKDGFVKMIDFGVAKAITRLQQTQPGLLKGKIGYMSPEQVQGEDIDYRSDIFALGVVLWEMCTSRRLFWGDNEVTILRKIRDGNFPQPSRFRDDLPPELEWIVMKALAYRRDDRFQTCGELETSLRDFLSQCQRTGPKALAEYIWGSPAPFESANHKAEKTSPGVQPDSPYGETDPWREPTPPRPEPRVLMVDDELYVQDIVSMILTQKGYDVVLANDGVEAVERVTQDIFDACLLDLDMPRKDGGSALMEIRRLRPTLPCVIQTANEDFSRAAEMGRLGAVTYLLKPVRKKVLEAAVRQALQSIPNAFEQERNINNDYPTFLARIQNNYRTLPKHESAAKQRSSLLANQYEYVMAWVGSLAGAAYLNDGAFDLNINFRLRNYTDQFTPSTWLAWIHLVGEAYRRANKRMFCRTLQNLTIESPSSPIFPPDILRAVVEQVAPLVGQWIDREQPKLLEVLTLLNAYYDTQWLRNDMRDDRDILKTVEVLEPFMKSLLVHLHRLIDHVFVRVNGISASGELTQHQLMVLQGSNPMVQNYETAPQQALQLFEVYLFDMAERPLFSLSPFAIASTVMNDESRHTGIAFPTQLNPQREALYRCANSGQICKPYNQASHPGQVLRQCIT
ncbi:MAG: response regulator [Deltaproteobacteria bacterium]|nr:MAG: response regulator [Deltaproteobacteria bacterium]